MRLSRPFAVMCLAAAAAGVGVVVIETGGVNVNPDGAAALNVWSTVVTVAAGLFFRVWRPGNPLGLLLVIDGFLVSTLSLLSSPTPALFATGLLFEVPATLLIFYILLAFSSGSLDRTGRIAFWTVTAFSAFVYIPRLFVVEAVWGGSPLAVCRPNCPDNPLLLVHSPTALDVMHYLVPISQLLAVGAVASALVLQFAKANRTRRRTLLPVSILGTIWISMLAVYGSVQTFAGSDSHLTSNLGFAVVMARATLPAAFLLAPLQARAFAGLALQRMLRRFESSQTLLARERAVAETLDDPRLRLAFWLPQTQRYVDATGVTIERPDPASGLAWMPIRRAGEPFAALIHDASLTDDPELIGAAARALPVAVNSRLIEADLERSVDTLQRSRQLLLEADTADRRRLERDLHATAQQHLVALRVSLELTRERVDENTALAERLASLGSQLDRAMDDLRRIAADIYSPVLEQSGLTAALRDAARRSQKPVRLELEEVGRLPPNVESCVYICVLEALANVFAHAGGSTPRLRLSREATGVTFSVADDGVGFDPERLPAANGLHGIAERLAAVGGTADVVSVPGRGTLVSGHVPIPAALSGASLEETYAQ